MTHKCIHCSQQEKEFTILDGNEVAAKQLQEWCAILKPEISIELIQQWTKKCTTALPQAKCGHDIPRGTDIDEIVHSLKPKLVE